MKRLALIGLLLVLPRMAFAQKPPQPPAPQEQTEEEQEEALRRSEQERAEALKKQEAARVVGQQKAESQEIADERSTDESRKNNLRPVAAEPRPSSKIRFTADPVGDGAVLGIGIIFGALSSAILGTNEIRPQQISPNFRASQLLWIDRSAVKQTPDKLARTLSNFGLWSAVGYVVIDSIADGFREGKSAALVDAIMYAEAFFLTQGVTNVAKIAFRRPRPQAYIERETYLRAGGDVNAYDNSEVDSSLSFVSGHASQTAAMASAATYIAFSRSPGSPRAWLTLAGGTLLTTFVSYERVRAAAHFPTDVMAGAIVGAGVGALVVHLHREDSVRQRPVWIGGGPVDGGGMINMSGLF